MIGENGVAARLTGTWFGESLSSQTRERLGAIGELRRVDAGAVLLREGAECDRFGILLDGLLSLRVAVAGRGRATLMTVEPGETFGWSAVVPPYRSTSTVVALQPSEVLVFDAEQLRALLRDDDALAATIYPRLLQCVSRRLVATRTQLLDLYAREREYEPW
ncbi:MAG TPA: cyclic nucleotide-binding domain-containing protein [Candidatus Limnocylindria bacterium]|jgi:CRP-like cAMP-binding protein